MRYEYYKSFQDIRNFISDMPLECFEYYVEDYVDLVAEAYLDLLESKEWKGWYADIPEISDDEFWECFKCGEKQGVK